MKLINPTTMFKMFSTKSAHKLENEQEEEQVAELTTADVLKTIELPTNTAQVQEEILSEMTKDDKVIVSKLDTIFNAVKNALFSNEVEEEPTVTEEVVEDAPQETVSEETEVVEETPAEQAEVEEQPKQDSEEIEPSEDENVEAVAEEEKPEEGQEEPQADEEPAEVVEEEQPAEEVTVEEVEVAEPVEEIEQPAEQVTDELPVSISAEPEVKDEVSTSDLLKQIEDLKAVNAKKEEEIAKMTLAKEVEADYAGVPGKLEDKVSLVFEIKNSALSDSTKDFIFNSLKNLSTQNIQDCAELGHDQEVEVDGNVEQNNKIEKAMKEHSLTENQALLYVRGERTLEEAKKMSNKVRNRK